MQDNLQIEDTLTQSTDLRFYIDIISNTVVSGWVASANEPQKRFSVKLLIDGMMAGECVANNYRGDVKTEGTSDGYCGYVFNVPTGSIRTAEQVVIVVDDRYEFRANDHTQVQLTKLPSRNILKLKSDKPVTWLDITDLIFYLWHHRRVSGIQRVQAGLLFNILANKKGVVEFRFCIMNAENLDFYEISAFNLKTILTALETSEAMKLEEWKSFITKLSVTDHNLQVRFDKKDCLIILGASWVFDRQPQGILNIKREFQIKIIKVIYDLIPILKPEIVTNGLRDSFAKAIFSALVYADGFLTISKFTTSELHKFIVQQNISEIPPIIEFSMGTELSYCGLDDDIETHESEDFCEEVTDLLENPFVLFVSTIEIRKNHIYVFRIWQRLIEKYGKEKIPNLVFVGRKGWLVDDLFAQLDNSENLGGKVIILDHVSDSELKILYENCQFTVYPSIYEGWGLPVSESLNYGKVCVASNISSVPEAGGNLAIYIDPYDLNSGYHIVEELLFKPNMLKEHETMIHELYQSVSWKNATESFIEGLRHILVQLPDSCIPKESAISRLLPVPIAELGSRYKFYTNQNDEISSKHSLVQRWQYDAFCLQVLQKKWQATESEQTWCQGKSAYLAFSLHKKESTPLLLVYLELLLPGYFGKRTVTAKTNNQSLAEWVIDSGQGTVCKLVELKTKDAIHASNGDLVFVLQLELDRIVTAQEANISDNRVLGIGIRSMTLIDGSDLLQRVRMLEVLFGIGSFQSLLKSLENSGE